MGLTMILILITNNLAIGVVQARYFTTFYAYF